MGRPVKKLVKQWEEVRGRKKGGTGGETGRVRGTPIGVGIGECVLDAKAERAPAERAKAR